MICKNLSEPCLLCISRCRDYVDNRSIEAISNGTFIQG